MDVQREFAAALRRIDGDTYKRVLDARARIWKPTLTEQAEIDAGVGEYPQQRNLRKVGAAIKDAGDRVAQVFAPFTALWEKPAVEQASRRQKALNDLSAMLPTGDLETLGRIVARGTPLWQLDQFSAMMQHPKFGSGR